MNEDNKRASPNAAAPPSRRLFLERRSYRQRRLVDGLRLLPILAVALWMIPLVWPKGAEDAVSTSGAALYIFGIWYALIVTGAVFAFRVESPVDEANSGNDAAGDPAQVPPVQGRG